jgi:solute carrier family 39 (zinc transporter), member 1/2/3
MSTCYDTVLALNATIANLTEALLAFQAPAEVEIPEDPCAGVQENVDVGLYVGAVFIILVLSALGVLVVLAGTRCPALRMPPIVVLLGKTFGTGVVLSSALVHMLLPAHESLSNECVPTAFREDYEAYAYLFALLSALAVHNVEVLAAAPPHAHAPPLTATAPSVPCEEVDCPKEPSLALHVGPTHFHIPVKGSSSVFSVLAAEFGFTVHSFFVGLAVGVATGEGFTALLIALSFHQFFEGVSVGARIAESTFSFAASSALTALFAVSAPVGIAAGIGILTAGTVNTNGETFLLVQGIFDAICAGLLLHIGFSLLIEDFPRDLALAVSAKGERYVAAKRAAMFFALWAGAGGMSYLGTYL